MGVLSKRVQVLFPEENYAQLSRLARGKGASVGALIRQAVEEKYLQGQNQRYTEILERLAGMNLPVDEWPKMAAEITQGALGKKKE